MRARFTIPMSGTGYAYSTGQEVAVEGAGFSDDRVPESVGRRWLARGVLKRVESAALTSPETAAFAAAHPRS